jgi:hypothetical protein
MFDRRRFLIAAAGATAAVAAGCSSGDGDSAVPTSDSEASGADATPAATDTCGVPSGFVVHT